jgi:hypothetical protein
MLKRSFWAALLIGLGLGAPPVFADEPAKESKLPEAPKGYSWVKLDEIGSAFLKPDGWHFRKEVAPDVFAFFITREKELKEGQFQTGLTVNVFGGRKELDAVKYAQKFVADFHRKYKGADFQQIKQGNLVGYSSTVQVKDAKGEFSMYVAAIGNSKTNMLYVMFFESSPKDWDEVWKIGQVIAREFVLPD